MKKILAFLLTFPILFSCTEDKKTFSSLMGFIPPETAVVLKTEDFGEFQEAVSENSFFSKNEVSVFEGIQAFSLLDPKGESLLCFSLIGRDLTLSFITKNNPKIFPEDSTQHKIAGKYTYDGQSIEKHILNGKELYAVVLGKTFVASDSKLIVESVVRAFNLSIQKDPQLQKLYEVASGNASVFIHHKDFEDVYHYLFPKGETGFLKGFADWTVLDIEVKEEGFFLNGVVISEGDIPKKIDLFKKILPRENQLAQVVPLNSKGFYSFTYDDFHRLRENLRLYRKTDALPKLELEALFLSAKEIGIVYGKEGQTLVLVSKNPEETEKALLAFTAVAEEFRDVPVYGFSKKKVFKKAFSPLVKTGDLNFYAKLGGFFVFAADMKSLENSIANFQNGSVLGKQESYNRLTENLSGESSILLVGINRNLKGLLAKSARDDYRSDIDELDFNNYRLSALQFVHSEGFAHANAVFAEAGASGSENVVQIMALELEGPGASSASATRASSASATGASSATGKPRFFEYWRTGEQYILAQDEQNRLYLFDWEGNLKWKKQIDGRILGGIHEVDLFKNQRLQMAFATPGKFYVIDRLGNPVPPFPVEFGNITQPLSVFDYAKNRDYRFVIVQDKKINMLDSKGKEVKGFEFNKSRTSVLQAPKHIRIGRKDYIVIPEKSGKLNILNRQGSARVNVEKEIGFSENPWFLYNGKFISTNAEGDLVQVDEKGNVSTSDIGLSENHQIDATPKLFVGISENTLIIGNKKIELDYGLYSKPEIFEINGKTYISITDTQASKVYLFNEKGNLLPGFPVYGNSSIDLGNLDGEGKLEFVVKGEENRVLVYRLD